MDDVGGGLTGDRPFDPRFINIDDPTPTDTHPPRTPPPATPRPAASKASPPAPAGPRPTANSAPRRRRTAINHEKWRVPTVLAATVAVALGAALAALLAWTAWRRARKRRRRLLAVRAQLERNQRELQMRQ